MTKLKKAKQFAYSTIANLINIKVLGMTASKYGKENDIPKESAVRDTLSKELLDQIKTLEKDIWGYIKYAEITDYQILKNRIYRIKREKFSLFLESIKKALQLQHF